MEPHQQAVAEIAAVVRRHAANKEPFRIAHGSTNTTRPRPGPGTHLVDISALSNVIAVDAASRTAVIEPNVSMDRLVEATLPLGLVPPVVMEFPGITAGGGFAGVAGESSSFRFGAFDETVESVELVLGNGDVVNASREERADLFRGAAGSLGTLGILTLLTLRLIPARKWVRTTYRRVGSVPDAVAAVHAAAGDPANDYVDGILFAPDHGVVILGQMTDDKPEGCPAQTFSRPTDPWYYLHVQDRTRHLLSAAAINNASSNVVASLTSGSPTANLSDNNSSVTDFIPLAEYLFRWDRGGFWVGKYAFTYCKVLPFTPLFRRLFDLFMHTRMLFRSFHGSGEDVRFIIQDLVLPYAKAVDFITYTSKNLNIWPLWLCPLKQTLPPTFHPYASSSQARTSNAAASSAGNGVGAAAEEQALDIGLWGWGPVGFEASIAKNREIEDELARLGGRKVLYAQTYYTEEEFWQVYGDMRAPYAALRRKYHASTLPTVYDKVRTDFEAVRKERRRWERSLESKWPFTVLCGMWKGYWSGDFRPDWIAKWKYKEEKVSCKAD